MADIAKKTLKDSLPREFNSCYSYTRAWAYRDVEVVEVVDGCLPGQGWPGPHQNVMWWYKLANGAAVGWNESPSRGWSFPVHNPRKKK